MFTFVVTCYQQEEFIAMSLESVKYQIQRYGQEQQFQLIVTDDGSKDSSCEVIRQWLEQNSALFAQVDLLFNKENAGICRVYVDALRRVEGEQFLVLNGDDLLSPYNVFELAGHLEEYDIVAPAFLRFVGSGQFLTDPHIYLEVVLQRFITGKKLYYAARLGCPIMGIALYRKSLLTEEVFAYILRFRTVNDRACFQKILEQQKNVSTYYSNRPSVLYRMSPSSLSNMKSPSRILHDKEIAQMCRFQRETEKSHIFRLLLLWQEKSTVLRHGSNRYIRMLRFLSPYFLLMLWLYIRHPRQLRAMERELVDRHLQDCADHYQAIQAQSFRLSHPISKNPDEKG